MRFDDSGVLIDGGDAQALARLLIASGDELDAAYLHLLGYAGDDEAQWLLRGGRGNAVG